MSAATPALLPVDLRFLERHRVGRLATADLRCRPHVVPVCFVVHDQLMFIPLDEKPKRVAPSQLVRARNIRENPAVTFLVDDYSDDWEQLAYLFVRGTADFVSPGEPLHEAVVFLLRQKYWQYKKMRIDEQPAIRITPTSVKRWSWTGRWDDRDA